VQSTAAVASVAAPAKTKKKAVFLIIAAIVVVLAVIGCTFIPKMIGNAKAKDLEESLVGQRFSYREYLTFSYTEQVYTFKSNGDCELYSYYGALGSDLTYKKNYQIEYVSKDEILLHIGFRVGEEFNVTDTFRVNLYSDGEIRSFISETNEVYTPLGETW